MKSWKRTLATVNLLICYLVTLLILSGCGGGGGKDEYKPPPSNPATGTNTTSSDSGNIKGLITKTDDGLPQDFATVATSINSTVSGINGSYEIIGEKAEIRTVSAAKVNYQTSKKNVLVAAGQTATCNIKMPPNPSGIAPPPVTTGIDDNDGPVGQQAVITGNGFGASEGVINFGGFQATVISWNSTSITTTVPIGLIGKVPVEVIRYNDGQKSGDNIEFTITP